MSEFVRINAAGDSISGTWLRAPRELEASTETITTVAIGSLLTTRAVETIDGWCGQVLVRDEIVWQGDACDTAAEGANDANACVIDTIKGWFK